jgi:hypothetical protein
VQVKFPAGETRLAYLTAGSVGSSAARIATKNAFNTKCTNTMVFASPTGFKPSNSHSTVVTAPAAAGSWTVAVASATGGCAHFQVWQQQHATFRGSAAVVQVACPHAAWLAAAVSLLSFQLQFGSMQHSATDVIVCSFCCLQITRATFTVSKC